MNFFPFFYLKLIDDRFAKNLRQKILSQISILDLGFFLVVVYLGYFLKKNKIKLMLSRLQIRLKMLTASFSKVRLVHLLIV